MPRTAPLLPFRNLSLICVLTWFPVLNGTTAPDEEDVEHTIVYAAENEFAGWPANGGFWMWDNELLVGFDLWSYNPSPKERHHNGSRIAPYMARSHDGGRTWKGEEKPANEKPLSEYDFESPGFAIRLWQGNYFLSVDRGKTWGGPIALPVVDGIPNYARSNYIVTGPDSALLFLSTKLTAEQPPRTYVSELRDGAVSFLSWIGKDFFERAHLKPNPAAYNHSIMPSAVKTGKDHYVCAVRQRIDKDRWSDIYESTDAGKTWQFVSELERGSDNPVSLVALGGESIAAIYGWRMKPYGLRARISHDSGRTWGDTVILRDDAANNDIGYTRAAMRKDGSVVILYYYTTATTPEQHIAATIWRPRAGNAAQ